MTLGKLLRYCTKPYDTDDEVAIALIRIIIGAMIRLDMRIALLGYTSYEIVYNVNDVPTTDISRSTMDIVALWAIQEDIGVVIDKDTRTILIDWR